jgi:16S rRNA (cytidine1402-2'-O)-methyltransferase
MTLTKGMLYLVPTPIGNMGDITRRALEILEAVDMVACEDTRHSGALLSRLGLKKKLISYHDFNEADRARQLAGLMAEGASVAVITDAGSPGVSDPAYRIVQTAINAGITIVPLPGATAIIPALTASGLPTDRFFFEGFLSHKSAARRKRLESIKHLDHTLVFFESPHRVAKTLTDMREVLGDRRACLAREISKKFEEFTRGTLGEITDALSHRTVKGEIVLVVEGAPGQREHSCSD